MFECWEDELSVKEMRSSQCQRRQARIMGKKEGMIGCDKDIK
jgi:hypothetical protein